MAAWGQRGLGQGHGHDKEAEKKSIRKQNEAVVQKAKVGDLLEFQRGMYSHWAVFAGNGKIIHFAGEPSKYDAEQATVRFDEFWEVAGSSPVVINNILDNEYSHLPAGEILMNATSKLGATGYDVVCANCEHFATWCRYGKARSIQVERVKHTVSSYAGKIRDNLVELAQRGNPTDRVLAVSLLEFGQTLSQVGQQVFSENFDEQLNNLQPPRTNK